MNYFAKRTDLTDRARFDTERAHDLMNALAFATSYYTVPLFSFFAIVDFILYRQHFKAFLCLRLFVIVGLLALNRATKVFPELRKTQIYCSLAFVICSLALNAMLLKIGDVSSPYFVGLILVLMGMASCFRFDFKFFYINTFIILGPIIILSLLGIYSNIAQLFSMLVFVISSVLVLSLSKLFSERLYEREFLSRNSLNKELANRDDVILEKTREAFSLSQLSKQFSPQVVHEVSKGRLDLNRPIHKNEICVIFVDIFQSTDRFIKLDREDLQKIVSMYIDDVMGTFLKYDITIDKFLGDGILGFSNDPIKHSDYIERTIRAANEVLKLISQKQTIYDDLWLGDFQVKIGISSGFASVGFFGGALNFRTYTAIGRVVNLASRIVGTAEPNQVIMSKDVVTKLQARNSQLFNDFSLVEIGDFSLKGFEGDKITLFRANETENKELCSNLPDQEICPEGHGVLFLDVDSSGIYRFKCRTCGYTPEAPQQFKKAA